MCGIVGIVDRDLARPVLRDEVERMVRTLHHRGPDEEGLVVAQGVGLGMRRLAIVDLTGGQQPVSNEDETIQVVANGEIYNFEEVRRELAARGHRFRSRVDVEVIAHAYEEYGEAFVERLRGMFALALWDSRTSTLIAARDRAGEKPLYYTETSQGLLLASEVKALLARPEVSRELDLEALDEFLTYEYVIAPRTMIRGIRKLPAAHFLRYRDGRVELRRYWDATSVAVRAWEEPDAIAAVRAALAKAVDNQMMSDVPLGIFLSGGIDSSAVAAFMSQAAERRGVSVQSFSLGFDEGSYNELPYAREIAQRFGTVHREDVVTPDLVDLFDRLVVHLDEPFADVSLFPTYLVSCLARDHVKVVLGGDGGDELFGGYDAYAAYQLAARLERIAPGAAFKAAYVLASLLPPTEKKKGFINKVRRFTEGMATTPSGIGQYRWMSFMPPGLKRRLYAARLRDAVGRADVYQPVTEALRAYTEDDFLNRALYADLRIYLADDILVKVDRMSMATSVETRAPFLDVDVMELAFSMPGDLKIRNGERKYILKRALEGIVPDRIRARQKEGFSIPMKNWLRRELQPLMRGLLSPERLRRRGLFDPLAVRRLMNAHVAGRQNYAHQLFALMVFERWADSIGA
jgi:asparagine synthase (glutamine-hydrolysing)